MPQYSWIELAIMLFIIAGFAVVIWRGGQANPESTGRLGSRLTKVETKMTEVETEMEHVRDRLNDFEITLARVSDKMVTRVDLDNIEKLMARDAETSRKTWKAVERLEGFFIENAIKQRSGS
ncbi:hypothetical protein [Sphingorhabdus sp. 109]|uniref:hypothetical protein n=1 Tax=Sphingorhabdus sp. 109 TaxID=2653173 RepID=UPI0012F03B83|nr:hypothetical protein [Sphingorhabdus sp. 109]VWX62558.1 conserved hypothetical protein [Sphingorhabdus sp. 109]